MVRHWRYAPLAAPPLLYAFVAGQAARSAVSRCAATPAFYEHVAASPRPRHSVINGAGRGRLRIVRLVTQSTFDECRHSQP